MTRIAIREVTGDRDWHALGEEFGAGKAAAGLAVVCTPSAEGHVRRLFPQLAPRQIWAVTREPQWEDFRRFEGGDFQPSLVLGIGGGRALDAAKIVAHWGRGLRTADDLRQVLEAGGRPSAATRAPLLLAPTLASSGSESSKGAIVGVGLSKIGFRGDTVQADAVVHDARLWAGTSAGMRRHFAFDVFGHLVETTVSSRCTPATVEQAREGSAHLLHWLLERGGDDACYGDAMRAAFHAGLCLATAGTCLPHRLQYVVGPHTDTGHVDGIWMLSPSWIEGIEQRAAARAAEVAGLLGAAKHGHATLGSLFRAVHGLAGHAVPRDRFRWTRAEAELLAGRVTGDLAADPSYVDSRTLLNLLLPFTA